MLPAYPPKIRALEYQEASAVLLIMLNVFCATLKTAPLSVKLSIFPRSEVGGWPPLVICFQHYYDKEAILNRADMLERSGILVSRNIQGVSIKYSNTGE